MGTKDFAEDYVEQAFYHWYNNDRRIGNTLFMVLPLDNEGRKPSRATVIDWVNTKGWIERADALDAEVSRSLDLAVVDKRKKMYEEQERIANELIKKGLDFLNEEGKGIKTDASAIRAIELGLNTQRISTGVAEVYAKISQMSDDDLTKALAKMIGKPEVDENIIEAETTDVE